MIIRSASVVRPDRSIETMSSALASSSPPTMICDRTSAVRALPEAAGLPAACAAGGGVKFSVAFLLRRGRFAPAQRKHATSGCSFQARHSAECLHRQHNLADTLGIFSVPWPDLVRRPVALHSPIIEAIAPSTAGAARNAGSASAWALKAPRLGYRPVSTTSARREWVKPKAQATVTSATPNSPPIHPDGGSSRSNALKPAVN